MVYLLQLLDSQDEYFWLPSVGLWGIGEITAGLLVMGIPAVPKVIEAFQASVTFKNMLSRLGISTMRAQLDPLDGQPSLRTFGRTTLRNPRGQWDIIDTDEHCLVSVQAMPADLGVHNLQHLPKSITRESAWDANVEHQQGFNESRS